MKSKDDRKWRMPPEGEIAGQRMRDYTTDRSVAIIQHPAGADPQCGSGTCVEIGDRWFVATVAHNLGHVANDTDLKLIPRGERSHHGVPFVRRSHPRTIPAAEDVGWIELDPAVARRGGLQAVPVSQLRPEFKVPDSYLIQGYPSREVEQNAAGGFDPLSLCVGVVSVPPVSENAAIGLEYPPAWPEDTGLQLVHPQGFSGGCAWTLSLLRVWPYVNVEAASLVGLITTYLASQKTLDVVSIAAWLRLVAADNPDLGL